MPSLRSCASSWGSMSTTSHAVCQLGSTPMFTPFFRSAPRTLRLKFMFAIVYRIDCRWSSSPLSPTATRPKGMPKRSRPSSGAAAECGTTRKHVRRHGLSTIVRDVANACCESFSLTCGFVASTPPGALLSMI